MTQLYMYALACVCQHPEFLHNHGKECNPKKCNCHCKKLIPDPKNKVILSITISAITAHKFKNFVMLKNGLKKGGLAFEVERALREYMGEKDLDVFINDNEWKEFNK